ncbi:flagellar basal body rod protein FlgB [Halobacillus massiliensis]|uniref:flagellar basal body rod protein FlgB n=1 Tax=Halobacillus massiliensis TaxID=1926286 RepID=UPI0009E1A1CF|nr:flagellar basal body rod protein FlgB [Halobacillus massiliensis]
MKLFNDTFTTLEQSLNLSAKRNQMISANISNTDTPNYKAKQVTFREALDRETGSLEAKKTQPRHLSFEQNESLFRITSRDNTTYHHNGNNVDIDKEMIDLAKNQIQYQALVERLSGKFNSLKEVIRGGGS